MIALYIHIYVNKYREMSYIYMFIIDYLCNYALHITIIVVSLYSLYSETKHEKQLKYSE